MRAPRHRLLLLAVPLVLAGCGSSDGAGGSASGTAASSTGASSTASSSTASSSAASSGTGTSGSAAAGGVGQAGCPSVGRATPAGAVAKPTIDVDGDGRPDTEWIAAQPDADGGVAFGVTTASGAVLSATVRSASPVARSLLVADVTGQGEDVALVSDGRQVLLWALGQCQLVPVQNEQGRQYAFDLGFTGNGTGVGCADVDGDGTRDLVGLLARGTTITDTIVELSGATATNGDSRTISDATQAQLDQAHQVTCGDRTMAQDGVSTGP